MCLEDKETTQLCSTTFTCTILVCTQKRKGGRKKKEEEEQKKTDINS